MRFLPAFVVLLLLYSCAGGKTVVKQASAYSTVTSQGTAMMDDNGNELPLKKDSILSVYIETSSEKIVWDSAWSTTHSFAISSAELISAEIIEVGVRKGFGDKVVLSKKNPSHALFILRLQPGRKKADAMVAASELQNIQIRGIYKGKTILLQTGSVIELQSLPAY